MLLQLFGCYGKVNTCIREGTAAVTEDADKLGALYARTREDAVLLAKRNMAQNIPIMSKTSKRITSLLGLGIDRLPRTYRTCWVVCSG